MPQKKLHATMQRYKIIDFIENFLGIRKPLFFKYNARMVKSNISLWLRSAKKGIKRSAEGKNKNR